MVQYHPVRLIKTCELDVNKNYLMGYHPHGLIATGAVTMNTDGQNWDEVFPGIKRRVISLSTAFWLPGFREVALSMGFCSSNQQSIKYCLK